MHITARNYAAQAAKSLMDQVNIIRVNPANKHLLEDADQFEFLAGQINKAVHFAIPDGGRIFNDNFKGIEGERICMPFPLMTVEWFMPDGGDTNCLDGIDLVPVKKRLVLIQDFDHVTNGYAKGIYFSTFSFNENNNRWIPCPVYMCMQDDDVVPPQDKCKKTHFNILASLGIYMPNLYRLMYGLEPNPNKIPKGPSQDILGDAGNTFELFEALSCSNVSHEPMETIDPRKNAKRIKAGKLPIYETRILTIDSGKSSQSGMAQGGTHASPRQHLRRGHIRRLPDKNVWVNSCVVGRAEHGVIEKQYHVQ
jgi:hypothetical protein